MPFPGVGVDFDPSPQHFFGLRISLAFAQKRSQGKLRLRIAAATQVDRLLQSLLCLIVAAKLQVSQTNLVISLIVIWESIRSLRKRFQAAFEVLLLQALHALFKSAARLGRHFYTVHRYGVTLSVHWICSEFVKRDHHSWRPSCKANINPLLHRFITLLLHRDNNRTRTFRWR